MTLACSGRVPVSNSFYAVPAMPRPGCCCDRDGEYGIEHERCASFGVNHDSQCGSFQDTGVWSKFAGPSRDCNCR
eukprot:scaffold23024_cov56-Cyclotella_meneghiniana.AAC.1